MKKQLLLLTLLVLSASASTQSIHEDHIPTLINMSILYLLDSNAMFSSMLTSEASNMRDKISSEVQADIRKCKQGWSSVPYDSAAKTYKKARLLQIMEGAIIAHIKAAAERASNNHLGTVHAIEQEVKEKLEQAKRDFNNGIIKPGALKMYADFIAFQSHIQAIKNKLQTNYQSKPTPAPKPGPQYAQAPKLYNDNADCPICLEKYSDVIRINIHPCGHNMCEGCSKEYAKNYSTCSICRQWYDKARLEKELAERATARKNNC